MVTGDCPSFWDTLSLPRKSNHSPSNHNTNSNPGLSLTSSLLVAPPWTSRPTFLQYINYYANRRTIIGPEFLKETSRCIMSIRRLPNWWKCDNIDVSQTWFMKISVHFAKLKLKQPRTIKLTNNKCWETVLTSTTGHQTLVPERLMRHGCSTSRVFSSCSCGNKGWGQGETARCCSNFQFSRDTLTLTKLREFFFWKFRISGWPDFCQSVVKTNGPNT